MEFFRDSNIDFMGARRFFVPVSVLLFVSALVVLFALDHLNVGIDFAGGTQLTVRFAEEPDLEEVRAVLADAGIPDARIQRFGEPEQNEVLIKTPLLEGDEEGSRDQVVEALLARFETGGIDDFDMNRQGTESIKQLLIGADPDGIGDADDQVLDEHYEQVASAVMAARQDAGLLQSWDQLRGVDGVSPEVVDTLQSRAIIGPFSVLATESVGPQIGSELRTKGILAVVFSLLGMLAYIWIRFELRFGIGALMALVHDVGIVLGLFAIAGYEFNLTTVAAFLTVVGYSVNDTVVVFDRVRENLVRTRREPLVSVLNHSLNQTLSRTVLTSGTTLLAVTSLFVLGGDVIRGFAFVLMIGVLIGTYSSIFIASPMVLLWESWFSERSRRPATA